jgi:hypothetical protein
MSEEWTNWETKEAALLLSNTNEQTYLLAVRSAKRYAVDDLIFLLQALVEENFEIGKINFDEIIESLCGE